MVKLAARGAGRCLLTNPGWFVLFGFDNNNLSNHAPRLACTWGINLCIYYYNY
jgi:hypothetical protein